MEPNKNNKRTRDDSDDSVPNSVEAKRIRDDLFLDEEALLLNDHQDLASFMKSFEDELISLPKTTSEQDHDHDHDHDQDQARFGYLLEASDDELGLPPPTNLQSSSSSTPSSGSPSVDVRDVNNSINDGVLLGGDVAVGLDGIWGFEDEISMNLGDDQFVNLDPGLVFDYYSDVLCGLSDFSDVSWRSESLPAL